MRAWILWLLPCTLAVSCGGTNTSSGFADGGSGSGSLLGDDGGSGGGSGGSGSGSLTGDASGSGSGGTTNGCSGAAADYVYVLSAENKLYSFAPNLKQFTLIGTLQCQTTMQPNSMAVDRNADAYVNYFSADGTQGAVYKVSTQNASCSAQPVVNLPQGWTQIGMGYSTIGTSASEALYVDGIGSQGSNNGSGLGLVDFGKNTVGPIGPFTGMFAGVPAELTGTGDGRLFAFFTTTPVYVAQVDKSSGATMMPVPMTGVQTPQDWAFSFWGGHFYLYTSQGMLGTGGSDVTDYNPANGSIDTTYMTSIGFDIVGAGVSTCAPTVQPQ
jgi:hypothetical protein